MEKNQEIEISKTNRGKEQIILNRKFISLIFHPKRKTIQKKKKYIYIYINVLNIKH